MSKPVTKNSKPSLSGFQFSHSVIIGVLALVASIGGYGGYIVSEKQGQ